VEKRVTWKINEWKFLLFPPVILLRHKTDMFLLRNKKKSYEKLNWNGIENVYIIMNYQRVQNANDANNQLST
jgi:hypothetical protein